MKTIDSSSTSAVTGVSTHIEQPVSAPAVEEKDLTINFFIVGGVINIVMIVSYFIWAFGAWKKITKRKGR